MKHTTQIPFRGKAVQLFIGTSDWPGAFTTSFCQDASFAMVTRVLRLNAIRLHRTRPPILRPNRSNPLARAPGVTHPRFWGQTGQTLLHTSQAWLTLGFEVKPVKPSCTPHTAWLTDADACPASAKPSTPSLWLPAPRPPTQLASVPLESTDAVFIPVYSCSFRAPCGSHMTLLGLLGSLGPSLLVSILRS